MEILPLQEFNLFVVLVLMSWLDCWVKRFIRRSGWRIDSQVRWSLTAFQCRILARRGGGFKIHGFSSSCWVSFEVDSRIMQWEGVTCGKVASSINGIHWIWLPVVLLYLFVDITLRVRNEKYNLKRLCLVCTVLQTLLTEKSRLITQQNGKYVKHS